MHKWVSVFFLIVATMGAAAAQDLSSFTATSERMAAAFKVGDVETISQMYAEDARILPPGRDIIQGREIQGREAIKAFWNEDIKGMSDVVLSTVDVKGLGDSDLREIGQISGKTTGDNPQDFAGKYITIWHKTGDSWQITDDIWNLNK
jgi:ketosteroid isomerase-like protein